MDDDDDNDDDNNDDRFTLSNFIDFLLIWHYCLMTINPKSISCFTLYFLCCWTHKTMFKSYSSHGRYTFRGWLSVHSFENTSLICSFVDFIFFPFLLLLHLLLVVVVRKRVENWWMNKYGYAFNENKITPISVVNRCESIAWRENSFELESH